MKRNSYSIGLGLADQQPVITLSPVFDSTLQPQQTDNDNQTRKENQNASTISPQLLDSAFHLIRHQ